MSFENNTSSVGEPNLSYPQKKNEDLDLKGYSVQRRGDRTYDTFLDGKLVETQERWCTAPAWLVGHGNRYSGNYLEETHLDHLMKVKGKNEYVCHLYNSPESAIVKELLRLCEARGIEVKVEEFSCYFPGRTTAIRFKPRSIFQ